MAKKQLVTILILCAIVISTLIGPGVLAQSNCNGYSDCTDLSNFDSGLDGWSLEQTAGSTLEWQSSKTFGALWWTSSADGVMHFSGSSRVQKQIYMQPGNYRILWRGGGEKQWNGWIFQDPTVVFKAQPGNSIYALAAVQVSQSFDDVTSEVFTVDNPGPVMIEFFTIDTPATLYFDYIWVVRDDAGPTPTPYTGGPPTRTPLPGTATPVPAQATPIPSATPYCVNAPTATPGPAQFSTPTATATAGPTPTPAPNFGWSFLDTFSNALLDWTIYGNNVYVTFNANHTAVNTTDLARSAFIGYNPTVALTTTSAFTSAMAFSPGNDFTLPFYVDAWAMADNLPSGQSAYMELWARDEPQGLWYKIDQQQVSPLHWYPMHFTVSAPAGSSGSLSAIAFVSRRTDDPGSGGIYLDDVYLYGDTDNAPRCDGTYPHTTTVLSSPVGQSPQTGDEGSWTLNYPANKPCPPDVLVPNNFWGPMLAQLTIFLDNIYAMAPYHQPSSLVDMVRTFIASPVSIYFGIVATFFNLRIPLLAMLIVIALDIGRFIRGVWIIIKESIPFL